jgi:hypothetical protein
MLLADGDLLNGFKEYEWRWKLPGLRRKLPAERWQGERLNATS